MRLQRKLLPLLSCNRAVSRSNFVALRISVVSASEGKSGVIATVRIIPIRGKTVVKTGSYDWFRFATAPMMDWTTRIEITHECGFRSNFVAPP